MPAIMPQVKVEVPADGLCGVVLAAGEGKRLAPLTRVRPKVLCPVGNVPLVDLAIERVRSVTDAIAVNVHHDRAAIETHVDGRVHVSVEGGSEALGTAGALGHLRSWIAGRAAVVVNGDTWCPGPLDRLTSGWDGRRVRLALVGDDRARRTSRVAAALMPWSEVAPLQPVPTGLWEVSWGRLAARGLLDVVPWDGPCLDCGTPARYLNANMAASGGEPVIAPGATVVGTVERAVVWTGGVVERGEQVIDGIRTERLTVLVR